MRGLIFFCAFTSFLPNSLKFYTHSAASVAKIRIQVCERPPRISMIGQVPLHVPSFSSARSRLSFLLHVAGAIENSHQQGAEWRGVDSDTHLNSRPVT